MTRRGMGRNRNRSFAAAEPLAREDAVEALISGELDTDVLTDEDLNELLAEVPEEYFDELAENNPELELEVDDDEDGEDGEEDDVLDVDAVLDAVADGELDPEEALDMVAEAIETGEIVMEDEDGNEMDPDEAIEAAADAIEDAADEADEDADESDEDDGRSFAYDEDYDDGEGYYDEDDDAFFDDEDDDGDRAFSAADLEEAFAEGQASAAEIAEDAAQRVFADNRDLETRAFALDQALQEGEGIVEDAIAEGRIPPHLAGMASALMISANSIGGEARSFAAAEIGDYGEFSIAEMFANFITNLPRNSMFEPVDAEPSLDDVRSFTADDFEDVHSGGPGAEKIRRAVRAIQNEYAARGERVEYTEVFNALRRSSLGR